MITTLVACLALAGSPNAPASRSATCPPMQEQTDAAPKMLTRSDTVTLVKAMKAKWGRFQFQKTKLEVELPSKPVPTEYEPTEANLLEGVVIDYYSETEYESINIFVSEADPGTPEDLDAVFDDYEKSITDDYEEKDVKSIASKPFLGLTTKLWISFDRDPKLPQQYLRLLAVDGRRSYHITVSGHEENSDLRPLLDRIILSAKKLP